MTNSLGHQIPIELLGRNESGRIVDIDGQSDVIHRLAEMGLREDVVIRMVQPGIPSIVAIGDQRLCLRFDEGVAIMVEPQC